MSKNEGGLNVGRALQRITSTKAGCIRLGLIWCCGIVLGVMLAGCKTATPGNLGDTLTFVGVEAASCAAAQAKPATRPYLLLAGEVFIGFSGGEVPTPEALEAALSHLPGGTLTSAEQRLIWLGAVTAYRLVYRPGLSADQAERVRSVLQGIGVALRDGAGCVRTQSLGSKAPATVQDFRSVSEAVAVAMKAGR